MSSWISSWLAGESLVTERESTPRSADSYRGERLGLPEDGAGAVARPARKLGAFLIDLVIAALITSLFTHPSFTDPGSMSAQNYWSTLVWALITLVGVGFFGLTPGMTFLGIRVARLDGRAMVGPLRALLRTVLTALIVPAVIWDVDFRGWHDRAVGTVVVRLR
ncbi:MAG TPA: RDD family protein [Pseudonocardiaceae bacterium]|nr:RDD family protein [Pseudonocardiaceae bacterium]